MAAGDAKRFSWISLINRMFSFFLGMIKRLRRARLRRIMRGYRILKQLGQLDRISVVKQALTEHPLGLSRQDFAAFFMGEGAAMGEVIVRQYLLVRIGGVNLNCALLQALSHEQGCVVFPLPRAWRDIVEQHGFKVAHFKSAVLWQSYVCALLLHGVVQIGRVALAGIRSGKNTSVNQKPYAYFSDLGAGNLPQRSNGSQSHDVVSWYLQWPGRKADIEAIRHSVAGSLPISVGDVAVIPQYGPLAALPGWRAAINFVIWGGGATFFAALDCVRGRWWHALLLNQAAFAAQVRNLPVDYLAREYLFHNSSWIYRPLWTYEAERRGSTISFYFYATNCEAFKQEGRYPPMIYGWKAMTWPRYLVWDEYQADFVRRATGRQANLSVVGPIWFQGNAENIPTEQEVSIAVFDVTPTRASCYRTLGLDTEFYVTETVNSFLTDISDAVRRHRGSFLWKQKRDIGRRAHPSYRYFADNLGQEEHVTLVASEMSAIRVIQACTVTISLPFTSTALLARQLGKPSAYYDPTGMVQPDDRAAHGIPVLSGPEALEAWLVESFGDLPDAPCDRQIEGNTI